MALSTVAKVAIGAAAVGGAMWYQRQAKASALRKKKKKKVLPAPPPDETGVPACLENIWGPRQALIPEIYNELKDTSKATADQFFGLYLTPAAQGDLFERLAELYVEDLSVPSAQAALAVLVASAPCHWDADEWSVTMSQVLASTDAMAMVVLSDMQDVVLSFESPPIRIVVDAEADQCVAEIYEAAPIALHPEIAPELSEPAAAVATGEAFHLTNEAQGAAFLHLATMAANNQDMWLTTPILDTLRAIAPGCAWERKDHYTQHMADLWDDVDKFQEIVEADIGLAAPAGA